ncbi:hypothetical protein B0H10DRAFT_1937920 [Mycena sp. CBHHK59/15]|nr:hypothetical protein B0H10DRAFT_1937920 [Mycena sp. CBHHK59/15]
MSSVGQLLGNKAGYKNRGSSLFNFLKLPPLIGVAQSSVSSFNKRNLPSDLSYRHLRSLSSTSVQLNAQVLHVFFKVTVYWPAYLLDLVLGRYNHKQFGFQNSTAGAASGSAEESNVSLRPNLVAFTTA